MSDFSRLTGRRAEGGMAGLRSRYLPPGCTTPDDTEVPTYLLHQRLVLDFGWPPRPAHLAEPAIAGKLEEYRLPPPRQYSVQPAVPVMLLSTYLRFLALVDGDQAEDRAMRERLAAEHDAAPGVSVPAGLDLYTDAPGRNQAALPGGLGFIPGGRP